MTDRTAYSMTPPDLDHHAYRQVLRNQMHRDPDAVIEHIVALESGLVARDQNIMELADTEPLDQREARDWAYVASELQKAYRRHIQDVDVPVIVAMQELMREVQSCLPRYLALKRQVANLPTRGQFMDLYDALIDDTDYPHVDGSGVTAGMRLIDYHTMRKRAMDAIRALTNDRQQYKDAYGIASEERNRLKEQHVNQSDWIATYQEQHRLIGAALSIGTTAQPGSGTYNANILHAINELKTRVNALEALFARLNVKTITMDYDGDHGWLVDSIINDWDTAHLEMRVLEQLREVMRRWAIDEPEHIETLPDQLNRALEELHEFAGVGDTHGIGTEASDLKQWMAEFHRILGLFDIQQAKDYDSELEALEMRLNRLTQIDRIVTDMNPRLYRMAQQLDELI